MADTTQMPGLSPTGEITQFFRRRLLALLIAMPLVAGTLVAFILFADQNQLMKQDQNQYGEATAIQLAGQLEQYLVDDEVISLNVITTQLTRQGPVHFVAVYNAQNRLVAQSGQSKPDGKSYSAEITFQNSVIGFVRISVDTAVRASNSIINGMLLAAAAYAALVWYFFPVIWRYLAQPPAAVKALDDSDQPAQQSETPEPNIQSILVVRIKPAQYLERHFEKFYQAAKLYGGVIEQTSPEELIIKFEHPDAVYMAACTGQLIREVTEKSRDRIKFGGALNVIDETSGKVRKATSYLASLSEGKLLIAGGEELISERIAAQTFHHSLVADGIKQLTRLTDQTLVDAQAQQIMSLQ